MSDLDMCEALWRAIEATALANEIVLALTPKAPSPPPVEPLPPPPPKDGPSLATQQAARADRESQGYSTDPKPTKLSGRSNLGATTNVSRATGIAGQGPNLIG